MEALNHAAQAPDAAAASSAFYQSLLHCCGSNGWVERMQTRFPFASLSAMCAASDDVDKELSTADWLEAFAAHPRSTKDAEDSVLDRLEELNNQYFNKFGYIYIVCATGKSANEMLQILKSRLSNDPQSEITIAAGEQSKITKLRLEKLLQHCRFEPQDTRTMAIPTELAQRLRAYGQDHVLKFYEANALDAQQVNELANELGELDLAFLKSIFEASTHVDTASSRSDPIAPLDEYDLLENCSSADKKHWLSLGLEAISNNEVCALVMSGGQGTRLGFNGPKGAYSIGLPSEKSLFQLFAERIRKLELLAASKIAPGTPSTINIPLFVMTSPMNHEETIAFFRQKNFFGLDEAQLFFFPQGTLPCFTTEGKLMLESAHKLATASDGNGGIYKALARSGALDKMKADGIKYLHVFSVDNALCKVADPMFIGYCIDKKADCGNKVVWKSRANESVGVVAKKNGKFCIIEYSELDKATSELTDPATGKLAFGAANICNHFFTTEFLSEVVLPNLSLEYHVAAKKIPVTDDSGRTIVPTTNSGIKLESFIFDVFPLSSRMAVLSVPRETEFAPVKNPTGSSVDSPETARTMLHEEAKYWLVAAARANLGAEELKDFVANKLDHAKAIEISPLVSYNGEGLDNRVLSMREPIFREVIRLESRIMKADSWSIPPSIRHNFEQAGQAHIFRFIDESKISAHEACDLVENIRTLKPVSLNNLFYRSTTADARSQQLPDEIEPLGDNMVQMLSETSPDTVELWYTRGLEAVTKGMVGALVLAGGQGTRLGFDGPKGMYDIGLPSNISLFEMFALRILKVQQLAKARFNLTSSPQIPWLVMTCEMNHTETKNYFKQQDFFGLDASQIHFFCQGTLPCFTNEGKFILETPSRLSRASDGNGGIYPSLKASGLLNYLEVNNVQYLHVFSVDNVLCKAVDPVFIGYCIENDADCANKVVWKDRPDESVGVFAKKNGRVCVVEYSELDRESSELMDPVSGKLAFGAANICNHFYRLDFLKFCCNLEDFAEYHVAKKKIPYADDQGKTITPTTNTGIKLETFIFDVFQHSKNMKVLGVSREDEFAPVKNAPGAATDSPDTARHLVSEQCKRWLINTGATFDDTTNGLCEVMPSLSYNGEGLDEIVKRHSPIRLPVVLGQQVQTPEQ